MNDFKSKLPDMKELASMANKLFKSVKAGLCEIMGDYKKKRERPKHSDVVSSKKAKASATTTKKKTTKKPEAH